MSIKAFKQTDLEAKPPVQPTKPTEQLEEQELKDVSGGTATTPAVMGDGYATCC